MPATTSLREALFAGAKEVFETMIFMPLEPCADAVTLPVAESILGTVTFKGGLEGCMGICCTMACAGRHRTKYAGYRTEHGAEQNGNIRCHRGSQQYDHGQFENPHN